MWFIIIFVQIVRKKITDNLFLIFVHIAQNTNLVFFNSIDLLFITIIVIYNYDFSEYLMNIEQIQLNLTLNYCKL